MQRVFSHDEGDADLISQTLAQTAQQGTATSQVDAVLHDVGIQLGRCVLQSSQYKLIPAKVVSNTVDKANNLITIDKGSLDGVEKDMGVACGSGVVGVVYLVSSHYSVVIPVLNVTSSRISCAIRGRAWLFRLPAVVWW